MCIFCIEYATLQHTHTHEKGDNESHLLIGFCSFYVVRCLAFVIQAANIEIGEAAAAVTTTKEPSAKLPKIKSHRLYQHLIEINEAEKKM